MGRLRAAEAPKFSGGRAAERKGGALGALASELISGVARRCGRCGRCAPILPILVRPARDPRNQRQRQSQFLRTDLCPSEATSACCRAGFLTASAPKEGNRTNPCFDLPESGGAEACTQELLTVLRGRTRSETTLGHCLTRVGIIMSIPQHLHLDTPFNQHAWDSEWACAEQKQKNGMEMHPVDSHLPGRNCTRGSHWHGAELAHSCWGQTCRVGQDT